MTDLKQQIASLTEQFVAGVADLARKAAMDQLAGSLGAALSAPGAGRSRRGGRGAAVSPVARRALGAKRSAEEMDQIKNQIRDFVVSHPESSMEDMKKALGYKTSELALPMKKLIAEGAVKSTGQKRATKYFPGSGKRSKKAA